MTPTPSMSISRRSRKKAGGGTPGSETRSAGAGASNASFGTGPWSNPGRIVAADNSRATVGLSAGENSEYLVSSSHGFTIPSGATIAGIVVSIERLNTSGSSDNVQDARVRVVKGGVIGTTDKASATIWPITTDAIATYGSSSDLWGETWTDADINASGFGAALAATIGSNGSAGVDHIEITVHYTT